MNSNVASGKSIFYIEDDVVVLTAYRDRLQKAGFDVESSVDGIEAMHILAVRDFDLIILDLMLPRFNGTEILKAIRDNPRLKAIPVVVFSSNLEVVHPSGVTPSKRQFPMQLRTLGQNSKNRSETN